MASTSAPLCLKLNLPSTPGTSPVALELLSGDLARILVNSRSGGKPMPNAVHPMDFVPSRRRIRFGPFADVQRRTKNQATSIAIADFANPSGAIKPN